MIELSIVVFIAFLMYAKFGSQEWKLKKMTAAERKGLEGEQKVMTALNKAEIMNEQDTLFRIGTHSTQLDHLCILPNRTLLFIETKNKNGVISGSEDDMNWTQSFPNHDKSFSFYNPIKQNEGHIRFFDRIAKAHRLQNYQTRSLIVFTDEDCIGECSIERYTR